MKMTFQEFYNKYNREIWLILVTFVWIAPYFLLNQFSVGRTEVHIDYYLDSLLPLIPVTILFYVSSFVMVFMPYFFIKDKVRFQAVAKSYLVAMFIGYFAFLIWPIKALRPIIITNDVFSRLLQWIYSQDLPYNNFPSLHVALSMLSALVIYHDNKKSGKWMLLWAGLIAISTLTTKQHTLLDVLGGLVLSAIGYFFYKRWIKHG